MLTRDLFAVANLLVPIPSVCLSVCPSVCLSVRPSACPARCGVVSKRRHISSTFSTIWWGIVWPRVTKFITVTHKFFELYHVTKFKAGPHSAGALNTLCGKLCDFRLKSPFTFDTVEIDPWWVWITGRKS